MATVLFAVFPYVAVITAIAGSTGRYLGNRYSYSSLSSQLLENQKLFWGSVPWHYGITLILLAHLLAWLLPGVAGTALGGGLRLFAIEAAGLALAAYALVGLLVLIARRLSPASRARPTTSPMDWILLSVLLVQVASGAGIALFDRWGSLWYLSTAVPWLWSLARLQPDVSTVAALPPLIQLHFLTGFILIFLFPISRLVHIAVPPIGYLWRPYQVVIWRRGPGRRAAIAPGTMMATAHATPGRSEKTTSMRIPPDAASAPPALDPETAGRRRFLAQVSVIAGGIAALLVAIPSVAFLLGLRKIPQEWYEVGRVDDFPIGETHQVAFADPSPLPWAGVTAQTAAWLRRESAEAFVAYSINCTHLGCPVRWLASADLFMCPCHGGVFYKDGRVASGPPPQPLATFPIRVNNGHVEILTSPLPISGR
jgi:respiratory nitrate reductase gamma subunit